MKFIILCLVVVGVAFAQNGPGDRDDEHDGDRGDMAERPVVCMSDPECHGGWCEHGMCRCPPNHYGDHCEDVSPLRCIVCDGFWHGELSPCVSGWAHPELDSEICEDHQAYCKSEVWFQDGIPWIKRHGCSENCWEKEDCSPENEGASCVACCQYDDCVGGEKYILGGSQVITPSVILISFVSMFSYCL
ncbi:uncharacterized protein LOC100370360 [Saccoglossus kowalevskii]|uniref:Uncharacterized protein LOC100370360 n=1 Tax=Saccoglossus kowalevskii TaxID=10224 RepID=A0ABM0GQ37_SACKO|nr:PREDICTED: uncharacterized protein LOC100370360 [Saccoglossus kowalevskii]